MNRMLLFTLILIAAFLFAGCGNSSENASTNNGNADTTPAEAHTHADGTVHDDHGGDDHAHDEVSLGTTMIGDMEVEVAQAHGAVGPGKEGHLVVKLPYTDNGDTIIRAWIGTSDRTLSYVGKGEYAPSHDDYDIHAIAPDPLPENAMWWIEVEKPDGTKVVGSAQPVTE